MCVGGGGGGGVGVGVGVGGRVGGCDDGKGLRCGEAVVLAVMV